MQLVLLTLALCSLLCSVASYAKPLSQDQVPSPLKPWVDWVLLDQPEHVCPFLYHDFAQKHCRWPTALHLDLQDGKGSFLADWQVYQDSWISLPGDAEHWPQNVSINHQPATVMEKAGTTPAIYLTPGNYRISGEFIWNRLPSHLTIPDDTGLFSLQINNRSISQPLIKDQQLWLQQTDISQTKPEAQQNTLDIQVFRKVVDEIPLQVLTRLVLQVSGQAREIRLEQPLLAGFTAQQLHSELPATLDADGHLVLQLKPGHWQVDLLGRHQLPLDKLTLNSTGEDWPSSEIWVFEARPALRMLEITGLNALDSSQTNLPDDWKHLPAYAINRAAELNWKVIRRGNADPEPNQLRLHRRLWLDFSGSGYTAQDQISGQINHERRINALPDTQLGRITLNGTNQLITYLHGSGENGEKPGVEVSLGNINLEADSRITGDIDQLSVGGWEQNFLSVETELNLPPGWRLLASSGVDNRPDSWLARWTLLDLFMVLIAGLACARLWSLAWGIFALLTLALIWQEPDAPHFVWLNILAVTALIKVLPEKNILYYLKLYRYICWLALALFTLPFLLTQIRTALYPQLENTAGQIYEPQALGSINPAAMDKLQVNQPAAPAPMLAEKAMLRSLASPYTSNGGSGYAEPANDTARFDPKAHVQTGPGLPQWQWRKIFLSWNGGIDAGQQVHLWLLPPSLNILLNFLRVLAVSALALLMFGLTEKYPLFPRLWPTKWLVWLLIPLLHLPSQDSYADFPDAELLETLKSQLLAAPDCVPSCAQIPAMQVQLNEQSLNINLEVHAQEALAVPIPTVPERWFPSLVLVDGETAPGLFRDTQGLLWLSLTRGSHKVKLSATLPSIGQFILPLALAPKQIYINSPGWDVQGLADNGLAENQLQFSRRVETPKASETQPNKLPVDKLTGEMPLAVFVKIQRTLQLGLDWQVTTLVQRVAGDSAISLNIPLLPGEAVISPGVHSKDQQVEVNLPAGQTQFQWQSTLEKSADINLTAANNPAWHEVWRVDSSPIWHLEASGIPASYPANNGRDIPEWQPWPGEQLKLSISRPQALDGQTLTIDSSQLSVSPGQRNQDLRLNFNLRSSLGGQHSILLPEHTVLQNVSINGQNRPIRLEGRKLTLPVVPGEQEIAVNWQQADGISIWQPTPAVDLQTPSVNSRLSLNLSQDRWLLLAFGPAFGPAILFWGQLLLIALLSAGLSRIPLTPLRYRSWFLLLLGLSQIPLPATGLVIGWLMLLGQREQRPLQAPHYFNALQVGLAILTVIALGLLFVAVAQGLLDTPQMQVTGNQSTLYQLHWYQDRSPATLPIATVISLPLLCYRLLMLAWSLWLALALLDWLKWGWRCFTTQGWWREVEKVVKIS